MFNKRGFTLIELLVVIAIIGLLSVMAVVSFNNAREKARDARREGDLKQLNNAIQLYIQQDDTAPAGDGTGNNICTDEEACWSTGDFATALSRFSSPLPVDPHTSAVTGYYYVYVSSAGIIANCTGGCPTCNRESYQLYILKMEGSGSTWGFNDSECAEWITQ